MPDHVCFCLENSHPTGHDSRLGVRVRDSHSILSLTYWGLAVAPVLHSLLNCRLTRQQASQARNRKVLDRDTSRSSRVGQSVWHQPSPVTAPNPSAQLGRYRPHQSSIQRSSMIQKRFHHIIVGTMYCCGWSTGRMPRWAEIFSRDVNATSFFPATIHHNSPSRDETSSTERTFVAVVLLYCTFWESPVQNVRGWSLRGADYCMSSRTICIMMLPPSH